PTSIQTGTPAQRPAAGTSPRTGQGTGTQPSAVRPPAGAPGTGPRPWGGAPCGGCPGNALAPRSPGAPANADRREPRTASGHGGGKPAARWTTSGATDTSDASGARWTPLSFAVGRTGRLRRRTCRPTKII